MNKSIAILFLEFRELVSKQIIDLSSTLMRHDFEIRNLREELSFLKKQIDHLQNSVSQLGQALVEGQGIDPDDPF
tara:strand:+ start:79 stop:303 length:225 start_codon:yes stop_codon:yes gene_type:complete